MPAGVLVALIVCSHASLTKASLATCTDADKAAKAVVCAMDHALVGLGDHWRNYTIWSKAMEPFWAESFIYTPMYGIPETVGLRKWYYGENLNWFKAVPTGIFNQLLFLGDDTNASSMTYSIGVWTNNLGPLAPTLRRTNFRIMDAYSVAGGRITHNWMMIDMMDLLRQAGHHPLPVSPLPQGRVYAPMAMEGIPAPISLFVNAADTEASRQAVLAIISEEWTGESEAMHYWSEDLIWYGPVPFGMAKGKGQYRSHFLRPLHNAFADRRVSLNMMTCEGKFCAAHGSFTGVHVGTWLGHKASHKRLQLDFGMHWHVEEKRVVESWAIFDLPKLFVQIGVDLLKSGVRSDDEKLDFVALLM